MKYETCHVHIHPEETFDRDSEEFSDICLECGEHCIMCRCDDEDFVNTTYVTNSVREDFDDDEIPF